MIQVRSYNCYVVNCRSLNNKVDEVMDHFKSYNIDFGFVSETFLPCTSNITTATVDMYGYNLFHSNQFGRCKGCAVIVSKKLTSLCLKSIVYNYSSFDAVSLPLNDPNKTNMICLYRPPKYGSSFNTFLNEFHDFISELIISGCNFIICGDYNIHWNDSNDTYTYRFQDTVDELGLLITAPSGPTQISGNTLDLIAGDVVTTSRVKLKSIDSHLRLSDHYPILFTFDLPCYVEKRNNSSKVIKFRKINEILFNDFNSDLENSLMTIDFSSIENLPSAIYQFNNKLLECLDQHAPEQTKIIKKQEAKPPWFDAEYSKQRALRRKLEKVYKQCKSINNWNNYQSQSTICRDMVRAKKEHYFSKGISDIQNDQKALFKFVNKITDSSKINNTLPAMALNVKLNLPIVLISSSRIKYKIFETPLLPVIQTLLIQKMYLQNIDTS